RVVQTVGHSASWSGGCSRRAAAASRRRSVFIPRTLASGDLRLGRGPFARAVIVTILLAAALTAILTLSVVPGQVALDVGQVAQTEIRAPRPIHFPSQSQTDAARL